MPDQIRRELDAAPNHPRPGWRWRVAIAESFEIAVAIAGICGALAFMLDTTARGEASIGRFGLTIAWAWNTMYLVGALGTLYGLMRPSKRVEFAGLILLGCAIAMNALSVAQISGTRGYVVIATFVALVAAAAARAGLLLYRLRGQEHRS